MCGLFILTARQRVQQFVLDVVALLLITARRRIVFASKWHWCALDLDDPDSGKPHGPPPQTATTFYYALFFLSFQSACLLSIYTITLLLPILL